MNLNQDDARELVRFGPSMSLNFGRAIYASAKTDGT